MAVFKLLLLTIERVQVPSDNTKQQRVKDTAEAEEDRADRERWGVSKFRIQENDRPSRAEAETDRTGGDSKLRRETLGSNLLADT